MRPNQVTDDFICVGSTSSGLLSSSERLVLNKEA
jgi:hypothetical protein